MQPAQLSLLPDQVRTPGPMLLGALPPADVAEAVSLLGALMAKTFGMGMAMAETKLEADGE